MSVASEVKKALKDAGCVLVRHNGKHLIYQRPDGSRFFMPHRPADDVRVLRQIINRKGKLA